jgi:hypothetical protein
MLNTASLPADRFDEPLRRLPVDLDLDALAHQTKAIERERAVDTRADLPRLALARTWRPFAEPNSGLGHAKTTCLISATPLI